MEVPWTFQIVDVVFVSRASTYSLYFEWISGSHFTGTLLKMRLNIQKIIYAVHLKIVNLRRYSIGLPENLSKDRSIID